MKEEQTNKSDNPPGRRYLLGFEEASQRGKRLCREKFSAHGAFQDLWTDPLCRSPTAAFTPRVSSEQQLIKGLEKKNNSCRNSVVILNKKDFIKTLDYKTFNRISQSQMKQTSKNIELPRKRTHNLKPKANKHFNRQLMGKSTTTKFEARFKVNKTDH